VISDIERLVLSAAIKAADLQPLLKAGVTEKCFIDERYLEVFQWMLQFYSRRGENPNWEAVEGQFHDFDLAAAENSYEYYIEEILRTRTLRVEKEFVKSLIDTIEDERPEDGLKLMSVTLEALYQEVASKGDDDITEDSRDRFGHYEHIWHLGGGLRGVPTGFPTMDDATGGLQPEQLVTVVGLPKAHKSLILLLMAIAAHKAANRVMFVSFEMSTEEQRVRHDAFRAQIPYGGLQQGKLKPDERKRLQKMLRMLDAMPAFQFVHDISSTTTVSQLGAKVTEAKPNILFVDGAYLMDAEGGLEPGSPQALTSITRSMKRLAQRSRIPIVMSTQALTWKHSRRKGMTIDAIGYTSSFGQDSDVIFGIDEGDHDNERLLRIIASRNTGKKQARLLLDWDHGVVEELDEDYEFENKPDDSEDQRPSRTSRAHWY
jgi:replicative DNA helicase